MRVLLTAHQFFPKHGSGTEVLTRDSGVEMLKRGHEVHVLTAETAGTNADDVTHEDYEFQGLQVRSLGIPMAPVSVDRIRHEYDNELVARHVRRYLDEIQPDVAHIFHSARLSASIIDVFKEYGLPVVFTPTDFWAICVRNTLAKPSGELSTGPDDISSNCLECREAERLLPEKYLPKTEDKAKFYREIAERALARRKGEHPNMPLIRQMLARTEALRERVNSVDAILAPTKLMCDMLTTNGIDPKLVTLSPYGMKTGHFREAQHARKESGRVRFGYVGTLHPQKGLHVLIDAFKKLSPEMDAILRICGDFAHFPDYARQVYDLSRPDPRINFAGTFPNEKIAEELKKIDVLVVPSTWYENTPLVIYSAFAAKIPVVATNLGGMAEVVQHEENGLLFAPGDAEDLARQLQRFLQEPDMLSRFSGSFKDVRTVEDSVEEMLELYESLLRENPRESRRRRYSALKQEELESPTSLEDSLESSEATLYSRTKGLGENMFSRAGKFLKVFRSNSQEGKNTQDLEPQKEMSKESRVSEHWSRNVEARRSGEFAGNWLDHKAIQRLYINPMSTGSPDVTWFDYIAKKYFPEPVEKALSLGCGGGALERHALSLGICEEFDAYDISEGSVEAARDEARKAKFSDRVNYATADLNNISLEENIYDAVFVSMAVHHLENLEGVYEELTKALKSGGLFVFNEFVGPSQFQWTQRQLELCNELLATIPERYRVTERNTILREIKRPSIQAMNDLDPSESIRSAEIMPLTERYFDIVERRDYGGTLLHLVTMAGTIRNYASNIDEDVALMQRMIDFEKRHTETGDIGSDFTLVIARNRDVR